MGEVKLTILGAGSMRCAIPVMVSLARYYGERPLEVVLFDADEERLDLVDRLGRVCFYISQSSHSLAATTDAEEALEDAELVIVQVGDNCAKKMTGHSDSIGEALGRLSELVPSEARVLNLVPFPFSHTNVTDIEWPPEPTEAERRAIPLQILRYINQEEYVADVFRTFVSSPLKEWLDSPAARIR